MVGLLSDYTQLVKEYTPKGQQKTLWEEFLTGAQERYQGLTEQVQEQTSYDISQAYANYKKQQLQLQMNEQLGAGFQQQASQQLQGAYEETYAGLKAQQTSALSDVAGQYASAITAGEKEFEALGEQARTLDVLLQEYSKAGNSNIAPIDDIYSTETDEYGRETRTLTDAGRLWYYDVLNRADMNFQDWLLSETSLSEIDLDDRRAIAEALAGNNRQMLLETAAGIGSWDTSTAETTRKTIKDAKFNVKVDELASLMSHKGSPMDVSSLNENQVTSLLNHAKRNEWLVSKHTHDSYNYNNRRGELLVDDYGHTWQVKAQKEKEVRDKSEQTLKQFARGDIVAIGNKYYVVDLVLPSNGRMTLKELENKTN